MRLLCPAKINLHLRVGPRRDDGFHSLLSWFCTAGFFDTLILENTGSFPDLTSPGSLLSLTCDHPDIPVDGRNLVVKVADGFAEEVLRDSIVKIPAVGGGFLTLYRAFDVAKTSSEADSSVPATRRVPARNKRIEIIRGTLQKRIPAGAGLGGGSSDGARALIGLNALWTAGRSADFLSGFAGRFGSDLPFFFHGPSSICTGRGEIVRPVNRPRPRWVLLILPHIHMPTADVYRKFDAMRLGRNEDLDHEPDWMEWSQLDALALLGRLVNDLEQPAFAISPALALLRRDIENLLHRPVRMSGSGSSLFTLFDAENEARDAAKRLEMLSDRARVEIAGLAPDFIDDLSTQIDDAK